MFVEEIHNLFFKEFSLNEILDLETIGFDLCQDLLYVLDRQAGVWFYETNRKGKVILFVIEEQVLGLEDSCRGHELQNY